MKQIMNCKMKQKQSFFSKIDIKFFFIQNLQIIRHQTMQQDDQNTFKYLANSMRPYNNQSTNKNVSCHDNNLIKKHNILKQGINYIVPSFWYDELLQINQKVRSLQNITLPPISSYIEILRLCGLKMPQHSPYFHKKSLPKGSALYQSSLLQQFSYTTSKTLKFSKINNFNQQNQIEWKPVNPFLWNLIQLMATSSEKFVGQKTNSYSQEKIIDFNNRKKQAGFQIPKISVFFKKQFILEKGSNKSKVKPTEKQSDNVKIQYQGIKYMIPLNEMNQEILNQLQSMTEHQLSTTLILDKSFLQSHLFKRFFIEGFFPKSLPFKDLLKNLIEIECTKCFVNSDKFYVHDQFGQKVLHKFSTVQHFIDFAGKRNLIITNSPINEILEAQNYVFQGFRYILNQEFGENAFGNQKPIEVNSKENFIEKIQEKIKLFSQKKYIKQTLKKLQIEENLGIRSSFRPVVRQQQIDQRIITGTFYRSEDEKSQKSMIPVDIRPSQNPDQNRNLDSVTTNMDTPAQYDNQSDPVFSAQSYQNKRLHKHSSYNKTERKRKSSNYRKKKKINLVVNGKGRNLNMNVMSSQTIDIKKRIKHSLFLSLAEMQQERDDLSFLLENMRTVALDAVYFRKSQPILHSYPKQMQNIDKSTQNDHIFTSSILQKPNKSQLQRAALQTSMQSSLHHIASMIQHQYQPNHMQLEKQDQQFLKQMMFQKGDFKKDNEEIRTIIDNSEAPCSEVSKPPINCRKNKREKELEKNSLEIMANGLSFVNQCGYMSDGNNSIDDNEETI